MVAGGNNRAFMSVPRIFLEGMMSELVYFLKEFEAVDGVQPITARPFFVSEDLVAVLVTLQPHAQVPEHVHEHHVEIFDVVRGAGTFWLNGEAISFQPGMTIVVPAGVPHALQAADEPWILRETVHRHVYARKAIRRALKKRLHKRG